MTQRNIHKNKIHKTKDTQHERRTNGTTHKQNDTQKERHTQITTHN